MGLGILFAIRQEKLMARPDMATIAAAFTPYFAIAIPTIATQMSTPVGNYLLTMVMAPFGDDAVAAWAVVGRLTVLAFGGIFALSGAIGGSFGQNYGAGYYDRLRSTSRDAMVFCVIYVAVMWAVLFQSTALVGQAFALSPQGMEVLVAFTRYGVGGFMFVAALFVANAAFNNLGRAGRATFVAWIKDGVLSWPAAVMLTGTFGASGVIYGQAAAGAIAGVLAAIWGWVFVTRLSPATQIDPRAPRPYPNPDRHRIR